MTISHTNPASLLALIVLSIPWFLAQSQASPPRNVPEQLPVISMDASPIRFEVDLEPSGAILAGERIAMELTLHNNGTQPFRIPLAVPQIYMTRINLEFDLPTQPISAIGNPAFHSVYDMSPERDWTQIRQWVTVDPGKKHVIRSLDIFSDASDQGFGPMVVANMEHARVRVLMFLDDGNFAASDWADFTIEKPDPRDEDWRDDVIIERRGRHTNRLRSSRSGLLRQWVGGRQHWFVAFQSGTTLNLTRLPIQDIHQVIPRQHPDEGPRASISVLGTSDAGEWFVYLPSREHPDQPLHSLGKDKHWRLQIRDDDRVEILEADPR